MSFDGADCSSLCCVHKIMAQTTCRRWTSLEERLDSHLESVPQTGISKHPHWKPDLFTGRRAGQADPCAGWICVAVLAEEFAAALASCPSVDTGADLLK